MQPVSSEGWFIAGLAAGSPLDQLVRLWNEVPQPGRTARIVTMAARASILPTFAQFVAAYPECRSDGLFTKVSALGLLSGAKLSQALTLLADVAARPEARSTGPIAIKGAGLTLAGCYKRDERASDDVDLVVPPDAVRHWKQAAAGAGASWTDLPPGPAGTYQVARISRRGALIEVHVALFGDASLIPGIPYEELLPFSDESRGELSIPGVRTPTANAAREIAVHHFVFHHRGAETCGFQALQDLARLEEVSPDAPVTSGLPWKGASPVAATALVRRIVSRLRSNGGSEDAETRTFLGPLVAALEGGEPTAPSYAETIERMARMLAQGPGGVAKLFWTLFPPQARMRATPQESMFVTAARYAMRPPIVVSRYLRTRRGRAAGESFRQWHEFVARGGDRVDIQ